MPKKVLREVAVSAVSVSTQLDRLVRLIEAEPEHSVTLSGHRLHAPEEASHLRLREYKDLWGPPCAQVMALLRVHSRV